jgi:hypothetical protein
MLGSALVILTWAYPRKNRTKHGRILLLWLSIADFLSSCVYFTQTFHANGNSICEVSALLGIYFPVASFLWTDCIAYFLYLVVSNRSWYQPYDWTKLLRAFHFFVWSLSFFTIALVFAFGHAGYASDDDANDNKEGNTGGWCWITANSPAQRFFWELIGGKLIEWTSCLFVLPFLYTSVYFQLSKVEGEAETRSTLQDDDPLPPIRMDTVPPPSSSGYTRNALAMDRSAVQPSPTGGLPKVKSIESLYDMSDLSGNVFIEGLSSRNSLTATSEQNPPMSPVPPTHNTGITTISHKTEPRMTSMTSISSNARPGFFSKFYLKLAAVPLMLIFIRFWSSLRIVLQYARPHADNADSFFEVMQAFFDPSQGIFNALIFVFASTEDRQNLYIVLMRAKRYTLMYLSCTVAFLSCGMVCCPPRDEDSKHQDDDGEDETGMRERLILPGGTRAKADSSSTGGHPSLLDVSSDYECDSSERMSEFSFDMTDSSQA